GKRPSESEGHAQRPSQSALSRVTVVAAPSSAGFDRVADALITVRVRTHERRESPRRYRAARPSADVRRISLVPPPETQSAAAWASASLAVRGERGGKGRQRPPPSGHGGKSRSASAVAQHGTGAPWSHAANAGSKFARHAC